MSSTLDEASECALLWENGENCPGLVKEKREQGDSILCELFEGLLQDRQSSSAFNSVILSALAAFALDKYQLTGEAGSSLSSMAVTSHQARNDNRRPSGTVD